MILNPVIQGGSEEKVYKITNDSPTISFPTTAKAGSFVVVNEPVPSTIGLKILTESGTVVPATTVESSGTHPNTRAGWTRTWYFVMPAEGVTATEE